MMPTEEIIMAIRGFTKFFRSGLWPIAFYKDGYYNTVSGPTRSWNVSLRPPTLSGWRGLCSLPLKLDWLW